MTAVARKTLWREWPRFFPSIMATGFAGLLLIAQAGLVLGIFGSAAIYVTATSGDIWAGYPGTQSVNLGRNISNDVEMLLRMNPEVSHVEPMLWLDSDWRGPQGGGVSISVNGINPHAGGLMFSHLLRPAVREQLMQPGAVIVDRADLDELSVKLGDHAWIDHHLVHVIATISGLRALGGVNVLTSLDTARWISADPMNLQRSTYFIARLKHPELAQAVIDQLQRDKHDTFGPFQLWTAHDFARQSQLFWLFDTGAGVAVVFLAAIVFLVSAIISSQSLMAVVIGSSREYATLNALGAGMSALRWMVFEQAMWVGGLGLLLSGLLSALLLGVAHSRDVPVDMTVATALVCVMLVLLLAVVSGLFAMRGLMRADPALLLR